MRAAAMSLLLVLLSARIAVAAPLRVLAATEVRIEPRVSADRTTLTVLVRVRDDRGAPVRGRLELRATPEGLGATRQYERETDPRGEALFAVAIGHADRVFALVAEFSRGQGVAPSQAEVRVDLEAPFITLDVRAAATVDIDDDALEAVVSMGIGDVISLNPEGLPVALRADGRLLGIGSTDATGRAVFRIDVRNLGLPGVRTLRAEHDRGETQVVSPDRRLIVRGHTAVTLHREGSAPDAITLVGAVASRLGPVSNAAVRVLAGTRVLGAALTDERGGFSVAIDPDLAAQPDMVVRAVFTPSEPWYVGSESRPLRLSAPSPARVSWKLAAVPAAAALVLVLAVLVARRRGASKGPAAPVRPIGDAPVERLADAPSGIARVRIRVVDRATGARVDGATLVWTKPEGVRAQAGEAAEIRGGGGFEVAIRADGYAPRTLSGELSRGGEYSLRVPIRSWREELFERVRQWIRRSGATAPVLPTPREQLASRAAAPEVRELVLAAEAGTYGPGAPGELDVAHAEPLARPERSVAAGER